jgi:SAM-dependent methyltransferase
MKELFKDLVPPVLVRAARKLTRKPETQLVPVAGQEQPASYYDAGYNDFKEYSRHYADSPYYFIWCVLADRIQPKAVGHILDVGCGSGQLASLLRDQGVPAYTGVDFSGESIRLARAACPEFEFVCDDAFATDLFERVDYDTVVSTEFLEHVQGDREILGKIKRGTRVLCTVPNFPHPAHVRYFNSSEEVTERYSGLFSNFTVKKFLYGSGGMCFFVFEGIAAAS